MSSVPRTLDRSQLVFTLDSLEEAAQMARSQRGPVRAFRRIGAQLAEIYFYGELVIHAQFGAALGSNAVRRMLERIDGPVSLTLHSWPSRHTLLISWAELRRRALTEPAATQPLSPRVDDSEATARIDPPPGIDLAKRCSIPKPPGARSVGHLPFVTRGA